MDPSERKRLGKNGLDYKHEATNTLCTKTSSDTVACEVTLDNDFASFDMAMAFYGCVSVDSRWVNSSAGYLKIDTSCGDTKLSGGEYSRTIVAATRL